MSGPKAPAQQNEEREAMTHNKPGSGMPMPKGGGMPKGMMDQTKAHTKPAKGNK